MGQEPLKFTMFSAVNQSGEKSVFKTIIVYKRLSSDWTKTTSQND